VRIVLVLVVLSTIVAAVVENRRIAVLEDRLDCVATWLEKAKAGYELQMKEPGKYHFRLAAKADGPDQSGV
jgi:hypothetical protein